MFLLYCDETNLTPSDGDFFIYGGVIVPGDCAHRLHATIDTLRADYNIPPECTIKFNPKPDCLTHQQYIEVKQKIIEAAVGEGCKFLTTIILHNIATSPDDARRNEINRIAYHFNEYLRFKDSHGLVLIDRFSDNQIDAHLRAKFSIGITGLPYCSAMRLDRITGYHYSAIGQSHFSSVVDIILGSFRFAINAHVTQDTSRLPTALRLLEIISPSFVRDERMGKVVEASLFFSPKVVRSDTYRRKYDLLRDFLAENSIVAWQEISNTRTY